MSEPIVDSIEVPATEEGGNVAPTETAPVAPAAPAPEPAAPAAPVAPATPAAPETFELPDGRKVDGATLAKEFKENFLPDYTRKSQELARLQQAPNTPGITPPAAPADPLQNPEYVPKDLPELAKIIRESTLKAIDERDMKAKAEQKAVEDAVSEQLKAVKTLDKDVNENELFLHATKYKFTDLRVAHQNMKDMAKIVKDTQQATARNVQKRADPVSVVPGGSGGQRQDPGQFENAREYLRSLPTS